jgi:O-antigen/teichoic acid export membrane protein
LRAGITTLTLAGTAAPYVILGAALAEQPERVFAGRFTLRGRSLRQHTARGAVVNAAFLVAVNTLGLLRGFVVVAFLSPRDFGLWGVLTVSMGLILGLKQAGISDRYIQQDEPDQELAFQKAFTLETIFTGAFTAILAVAIPLIAVLYGEPRLLAGGFVALAIMPALALQSPLWVFYRRMEFVRQRTLQAIEPVVTTVVTIGLAAAGAGFWALLIGAIAGMWASALAAVAASPFKLAWRFDAVTARRYVDFSVPLLAASTANLLVAFGTVFIGQAKLGLAGAGAITLAAQVTAYADRVDQIVTQTMYPAVAAVRERTDVLFESFVKSNRLALMWGAPFGVGLALFAADLVHFAIGDEWRGAIGLLETFGLIAAVNHIAFNWGAFYRARGDTRPAAVVAAVLVGAFVLAVGPAMLLWGLDGLQGGMIVLVAAGMAARLYYVNRLFPAFRFVRYAARALAPTLPAAAIVLALRAAEGAGRTGGEAIGELVLFAAVCAAATYVLERPLLREAAGYLRSAPA